MADKGHILDLVGAIKPPAGYSHADALAASYELCVTDDELLRFNSSGQGKREVLKSLVETRDAILQSGLGPSSQVCEWAYTSRVAVYRSEFCGRKFVGWRLFDADGTEIVPGGTA